MWGKFEHEVLALPPDEYYRMLAYIQIKNERQIEAQRKAARKAKVTK